MSSLIIDASTQSEGKSVAAWSWFPTLSRAVRRRIAQLAERRRLRRDTHALLALDDRMLADVGLGRSDVEFAVRYGRLPPRP
jgi:uncharacterized protein YjiS (DUF1127 family)